MAYVPDATVATEPVDTRKASTAALEFRTIKAYIQSVLIPLIATKLPSASYTAADVLAKLLTVDGAGSGIDADLLDGQSSNYYRDLTNINAGTLDALRLPSSTYTPTAVSGSNISGAVTPGVFMWKRTGGVVECYGLCTATAASANLITDFFLTLPVASNLSNADHLVGQVVRQAVATGVQQIAGIVEPDTTNDRAKIQFTMDGNNAVAYAYYIHFAYRVL